MTLLTWPRGLIGAASVAWMLDTPGNPVPASFRGRPQAVYQSGGPFFRLTLTGILMRGHDAILAGQGLKLALGRGERAILVSPDDCRQVPLGAGQSLGAVNGTAGSPFDDFSAGQAEPIAAAFTANAALRATTVSLAVTVGGALREGMQFSVDHAAWGRRLYRLARDNGGGSWSIRPPLREAVANAQAIDFNRPGCVMRLDGVFAIDQVIPGRVHRAQASFCELERPPRDDGT